jgi:hypothetical protein
MCHSGRMSKGSMALLATTTRVSELEVTQATT